MFSVGSSNYYGQYGCEAVNELGVASKSLHVSGEYYFPIMIYQEFSEEKLHFVSNFCFSWDQSHIISIA